MVSNVLRGQAFSGIGHYSGGKGLRGAVGLRKIEGLGTVAISLRLEFKASD